MRSLVFTAALLCALPTIVMSQVPRLFSYQGLLTDADLVPVSDGRYDLGFSISNAGGPIWGEEHINTRVNDGIVDVILGEITPLNLPFNEAYQLTIFVDGEDLPPTPIVASPYCLNALRLDGRNSDGYLKRNAAESSAASVSGEVLRVENTGGGRGMTVVSWTSHGLYGKSNSDMAGVEGEGAGTGPGLRGSSSANHGTVGYSDASDKAGVFGNSPNRTGVWGNSVSGTGVYGLSTTGLAISGESGENHGVKGLTRSTNEWVPAIYGRNEGMGDGVYGWSQDRHGVFGVTTSPAGGDAGVYGTNNGGGPAIKSDGDLYVDGAYRGNLGQGDGAPFPRPAFDSGWVAATAGAHVPLGVGQYLPAPTYSNENFVIDLMVKNMFGAGTEYEGHGTAYWIQGNNDIEVMVDDGADLITHVRLRVWYYE